MEKKITEHLNPPCHLTNAKRRAPRGEGGAQVPTTVLPPPPANADVPDDSLEDFCCWEKSHRRSGTTEVLTLHLIYAEEMHFFFFFCSAFDLIWSHWLVCEKTITKSLFWALIQRDTLSSLGDAQPMPLYFSFPYPLQKARCSRQPSDLTEVWWLGLRTDLLLSGPAADWLFWTPPGIFGLSGSWLFSWCLSLASCRW